VCKLIPCPASTRLLLDDYGITWFEDSGWLQRAVHKANLASVKVLVEDGTDINETRSPWMECMRGGCASPLCALVESMYCDDSDKEMMSYLLEHGARLRYDEVRDEI
jgi:hypothetical protein